MLSRNSTTLRDAHGNFVLCMLVTVSLDRQSCLLQKAAAIHWSSWLGDMVSWSSNLVFGHTLA